MTGPGAEAEIRRGLTARLRYRSGRYPSPRSGDRTRPDPPRRGSETPKAGGGTRDQKSAENSKPRTGAAVSIASTLFAVSRRDDRSGKDGGSGGSTIGGLSFWKFARQHGIRSAARAVKMIRTSQRFLEPAAQRRSRLIPKPWPGRFDHCGPQPRAFPGTR